jgi:hypothetical protein
MGTSIPGPSTSDAPLRSIKVRILSSCIIDGVVAEVGELWDLSRADAIPLVNNGQAKLADASTPDPNREGIVSQVIKAEDRDPKPMRVNVAPPKKARR